jgi:hypothetical protein
MNEELDKLDVNAEPKVTLTLDVNELNLVLAGLQELPHKFSAAIINKIMAEAQKQVSKE